MIFGVCCDTRIDKVDIWCWDGGDGYLAGAMIIKRRWLIIGRGCESGMVEVITFQVLGGWRGYYQQVLRG